MSKWILILIVLIGSILRFYRIGQESLWFDELTSASLSALSFKDMIFFILRRDINMSFFNILGYFWIRFIPDISELIIRLPSAFSSILSIVITFFLGKSILNNKKKSIAVGLIAALLVAVNAYSIEYAQEFRSYSLTLFLVSLSTLFFIKIFLKPNSLLLWLGYILFSTISVYSHLFAIFILMAQLIILFFKNHKKVPYKKFILSGFCTILLFLPLVMVSYKQRYLQITWIPMPDWEIIWNFLIKITGNQGGFLVFFYILAVLFGLYLGLKNWKVWLCLLSFLLPIILALVFSFVRPIFWSRYLLLTLPFLAILAGLGFVFLINQKKIIFKFFGYVLILVIVALSFLGIIKFFSEGFKKDDFRGVAYFLSGKCNNGSLIVYDPPIIEPRINYYLKNNSGRQWFYKSEKECNHNYQKNILNLLDKSSSVCFVSVPYLHDNKDIDRPVILEILSTNFIKKSRTEFNNFYVEIYTHL